MGRVSPCGAEHVVAAANYTKKSNGTTTGDALFHEFHDTEAAVCGIPHLLLSHLTVYNRHGGMMGCSAILMSLMQCSNLCVQAWF